MKYQKQIDRLVYDVKHCQHPYVVCPNCGQGHMEMQQGAWTCLWNDCMFRTEEIPSEDEIQELINLKENLILIRKYKI